MLRARASDALAGATKVCSEVLTNKGRNSRCRFPWQMRGVLTNVHPAKWAAVFTLASLGNKP